MIKKIIGILALGVIVVTGGANLVSSEEENKESRLLDFLKSIEVGFYLDTSYEYNFNKPESGNNSLRIFDQDHNDFNIHMFQLLFKRTPSMEGSISNLVGFGVKLDFGEDADVIASTGLGDEDDEFDLQEAYIHILAPIGNGISIYAGKFVTLAGAEVIESKDNFNFSRSFLFGFAIPFTHTGIRVNYPAGVFDFTLGLSNGWDNVDDNNDGKTIEARVGLNYDIFSLGVASYFGPEQDGNDDNWRELLDVVATFTPFERLTLMANLDFGWEQDVSNVELGLDNSDVFWWGIAGYVAYEFNQMLSLAVRAEYFDDSDGFRTGTEQKLFEITPTLSIKPFAGHGSLDNLILRVEYRFDSSDEDVFEDDDGNFKDTQHTVATELIYYFSL